MINPLPRPRVTRRQWFGAGAGVVGAAVTSALNGQALAAPPEDSGDETTVDDTVDATTDDQIVTAEPDTAGERLDQIDQRQLMVLMMRAELATRDLYDTAATAGADPAVTGSMSAQHRAYAEAISGAVGESAAGRDDRLYDALEPAFRSSSTTTVAAAAAELESSLVATYEQVVALVDDQNWIPIISSIAMMEARHSVVLRTLAGEASDLSDLLDPTTAPLTLQELG